MDHSQMPLPQPMVLPPVIKFAVPLDEVVYVSDDVVGSCEAVNFLVKSIERL